MYTVTITFTLAGTDVGPFNLYSDADGYTTPFATGISKATLLAGYTSTVVPDGSTTILAISTGTCVRDLYMPIVGAPSTTTTTTSSTSSTTTSTTSTTTTSAPSLVNAVSGYMQPCSGGTIDDHLGADVYLTNVVSVDTTFTVNVTYTPTGGSPTTSPLTVVILAGHLTSSFDACTDGIYIAAGATVTSSCISSCDNPAVNLNTFGC